ncbi:MAG: ATP-binding protein [Steroidobacteraceae bacterium]
MPEDRPNLEAENAELRERLVQAESVIRAIREGEIDAVIVKGADGNRIFTLEGADYPYRALVESMSEGAVTLSEDCTILYSNPRLAEMLGTTNAELAGSPFSRWIAPEEAPAFERLFQTVQKASVAGELQLRTARGDTLPVQVSMNSLIVKGMRCSCAVLTDTSLAKHHAAMAAAAEYVRQVNDRLREADRRKDEFLATLAHELRNPLAPIRAAAYVLKKINARDDRLVQAREMIDRQATHMTRLIDDLLEMSRITQGKIELQRHTESLASVVSGVADSARATMEAHQHEFVVRLPDDPLLINADAIRIAQALFNVLENAAKYTPPKGRIELTARREGAEAVITVTDNGIGIAPDMSTRIFEMFVQASGSGVRRPQGGLGIGLALAHRLIEMHGGTISAQSDGLERGATFTVRLPLHAAHEPPPRAGDPAAGDVATPALRRVLIVDDNADAADSLSALLQLSGHVVRTTYRGEDALLQVAEFRPDVLLLDIGLPDMDGYEVARRIQAQFGEQRPWLVALSGWGRDDDKQLAHEAGIDVHLTKPVAADTLDAVLERVGRPVELPEPP